MIVDDIHSRLNATEVAEVVPVDSLDALTAAIAASRAQGRAVAIAGGRHAMGGQQLAAGGTLLDTRPLDRVLGLDRERGLLEVEAGIQWPALVDHLVREQRGAARQWGIRQKQTGADRFSIGGSVSANCHGRGLAMPPIAADVESLRLVRADGTVAVCSRTENPELLGLVLGGYGLFGAIYSVTLRLALRRVVERIVEVTTADELGAAFAARIADGFLYGDFQFAIDPASPDFLRRGILSCYRPVEGTPPIPAGQRILSRDDWQRLLVLAHIDKSRAFDEYVRHYLATSGQLYWSDLLQLSDYTDGYHEALDQALGATVRCTEVISELYVPRDRLDRFLTDCAATLREHEADVIYGTIRLIERDTDSFLAWAREDFACVILNLHTEHSEAGLARTAAAFRALIDLAAARGGSYFLTYHRWASPEQLGRCYPQFPEFLRLKRLHDPDEVFQSEWYRHYAGAG